MAKDATYEFTKKIIAFGAVDKTTKLAADLKVKWAAAVSPKDITTVYTNA